MSAQMSADRDPTQQKYLFLIILIIYIKKKSFIAKTAHCPPPPKAKPCQVCQKCEPPTDCKSNTSFNKKTKQLHL
jgi:hypothetical protein